jgi:hypothetical protein
MTVIATRNMTKRNLWLRWVAANAFGELFGLGATLLVAGLAFSQLGEPQNVAGILILFAIAVASGILEATLVGLAQWWAMMPWFPSVRRRAWWWATCVGALAAYVLGYLPSTLMSLGEQASQNPVAEPPQWQVLLLAAGLGAVGGAVLSFAQWLVLRRQIQGTGWWIPANMLAWLAGMPLIFWGIDAAQKLALLWQMVLVMGASLLAAGLIVGAIHGAFLVRLAARNRIKESVPTSG